MIGTRGTSVVEVNFTKPASTNRDIHAYRASLGCSKGLRFSPNWYE